MPYKEFVYYITEFSLESGEEAVFPLSTSYQEFFDEKQKESIKL